MTRAEKQLRALPGSIERKGSGFRWRLREGTGKSAKIVASATGADHSELFEKVKIILARRAAGIEEVSTRAKRVTVKEALDALLESKRRRDIDTERDKATVKNLEPIHALKLEKLSFDEVADFAFTVSSPSTANRAVALLNQALKLAGNKRKGIAPGIPNPLIDETGCLDQDLVRKTGKQKGSIGGLFTPPTSIEAVREYSKTSVKHQDKGTDGGWICSESPLLNRFNFRLGSGTRDNEANGVKVKDLFFYKDAEGNERIGVRIVRQADGKGGFKDKLKNSAAQREIMLADCAEKAVRRRLAELKAKGVLDQFGDETVLFGHDNGYQSLGKTAFRQSLARACETIGIPRITPHNLRGTWASLTLQTSPELSIYEFMVMGGWSDFKTAQAHYLTFHPDIKTAKARLNLKLDEVIAKAAEEAQNTGYSAFLEKMFENDEGEAEQEVIEEQHVPVYIG